MGPHSFMRASNTKKNFFRIKRSTSCFLRQCKYTLTHGKADHYFKWQREFQYENYALIRNLNLPKFLWLIRQEKFYCRPIYKVHGKRPEEQKTSPDIMTWRGFAIMRNIFYCHSFPNILMKTFFHSRLSCSLWGLIVAIVANSRSKLENKSK